MGPLAEVFDLALVTRLAGPAAYGRGVAYLRDRRVETADVEDRRLEATVRGTMPYRVELWADRDGPRWSCTCPAAEDGSFCKHAVAAALSPWAGDDSPVRASPAASGRGAGPASGGDSVSDTDDELAVFVGGLPPERLIEIVLERARSDWRLRERLEAEARAARGAGLDMTAWRRRIDRAFAPDAYATHGFVVYRDAAAWAAEVNDVIDALEELCEAGHHDAGARLAEHAHRRAEESIDCVDDSDGWLTGFSERLSELHFLACDAGSPDPVELAARLVEMELTSELEGFHRSAAVYAEILGEAGLDEFRERLEPHRKRVANQTDEWSGEEFSVRQAMVGWALGTDDPDALIEVHTSARGDRMLSCDVLETAQALDRAGRGDEAVAWARRGMSDTGDRSWHAGELREFLARKLRDRGEEQAAVDLFWQAFAHRPSLTSYRRLLDEDEGVDWLSRCRGQIRSILARDSRSDEGSKATPATAFAKLPPGVSPVATALVQILLYEGRVDAAWEAARDYGCSADLWTALARAREKGHPLEAAAVYEAAALAVIDRKKANQYESAVDLMVRIRRLADSAGEPGRFVSLLERVRTEHKPKRKLMALLNAQGW